MSELPKLIDLGGELLLCVFILTVAALIPVWGWWMFRFYFPKGKRDNQ